MGSGAFFFADYGAADERKLQEDIRLLFVFIFAVTICFYLVIYIQMKFILNITQIPQKLMKMTGEYMVIVFIGIIFVFHYNFFAYLLGAMGNSIMPLIFLGISSRINIR